MVHDSRNSTFRSPTGALPVGARVVLSVLAQGETEVTLLWRREGGETAFIPMTAAGDRYTVTVTVPDTPGLCWYRFRAGDAVYGAPADGLGGEGEAGAEGWFQVTVYAPEEIPAWYENAVVYQIFPDRFCRGDDFRRRWLDKCASPVRGGAGCLLDADWDDTPFYTKRPDGLVSRWQFYGGTLEGIREKLEYLAALGIGAVYLNPIFLAASNHRYDTADYFTVDPLLGDEESFSRLCREAADRGIRILLDGVFSHTGADSRYFNRFSTFPAPGAWQGGAPYRDWYDFTDPETGYKCWWGVKDLPTVDKSSPTYREMLCGENGVIRKWLRLGASGWRLDVADELPEDFLKAIRAAAAAEKPDALILGEVWEDASNKISYGVRRTYLLGGSLHSVMNYPFRRAVLDYLTGAAPAGAFCRAMASLWENYPPSAMRGALNLLGSHDRVRVMTALGSEALVRLAMAIQTVMPGVPCLYYGDEAGLTGGADPENRGTFPWDREKPPLAEVFRSLTAFRRAHPLLVSGRYWAQCAGEDVLCITRADDCHRVSLWVNRAAEPRDAGEAGLLPPQSYRLLEA